MHAPNGTQFVRFRIHFRRKHPGRRSARPQWVGTPSPGSATEPHKCVFGLCIGRTLFARCSCLSATGVNYCVIMFLRATSQPYSALPKYINFEKSANPTGLATPSENRTRKRHRFIGSMVFPVYLPHQAKAISLAMSLTIGYRSHFAAISHAKSLSLFALVWLHHMEGIESPT